ncbi:MAG: hypothetical protein WCJ28_06355, partial [Actinomycetota bacterium]
GVARLQHPFAYLLADAAGTTVHIDHDYASATHDQVGSAIAGRFGFQAIFDFIIDQEPELAN